MKTTKRLLLGVAWLAVFGYGINTTIRIRQLEAQVAEARLQTARVREAPAQLAYSFDSSFMQYFGQAGVDAVDRAVRRGATDPDELLRAVTRDLKLK
jgi:hypothetical protein